MKRMLSLFLVLLFVLGTLSGLTSCAENGTQTDTSAETESRQGSETEKGTEADSESAIESDSESATESESESVTESESESESASETESESESETESETERPTAEELEARREEIYNATAGHKLPIASFGATVAADRMQAVYELMLEAGINTVITLDEIYNTVGEGNLLDLALSTAKQTGMDVIVCARGLSGIEMYNKLCDRGEYYDIIRGIYLKDEPIPSTFDALTEIKNRLRDWLPESANWQMGANMLPLGIDAYEPGNKYDFETTGWEDTVRQYMDIVDPDFLCFDYYPWSSGGSISHYLANLLLAKIIANDYDVPLYTFIEANFTDNTLQQLSMECHLSLANGAESLYLFLATAVGSHNYGVIFNADGSVNWNAWGIAEWVFNGIHAMKGVYLDYDWQNTIFLGKAQKTFVASLNDVNAGKAVNTTGSFGALTSAESDNAVIGCFEKENGEQGLYVVNCNLNNDDVPADIVLHFGEEILYEIWGTNGLEEIGYADTLTLTIFAGEGKFVMVNPTLPE